MFRFSSCRQLQPQHQTLWYRSHSAGYEEGNVLLFSQPEQMKEAGPVNNVRLPLQRCPRPVILIEDVGAQKGRLQALFIFE